jgi:uncharacterized repeat protein (TIGR03803 family)
VVRDAAGNLYGATMSGGSDNEGTVFEVPHLKPAATSAGTPDDAEAPEE